MHAILAELGDDRFEPIEHAAQVRAPDVSAVDDAERQHAVFCKAVEVVELVRCAHEIEMQAGDGKG